MDKIWHAVCLADIHSSTFMVHCNVICMMQYIGSTKLSPISSMPNCRDYLNKHFWCLHWFARHIWYTAICCAMFNRWMSGPSSANDNSGPRPVKEFIRLQYSFLYFDWNGRNILSCTLPHMAASQSTHFIWYISDKHMWVQMMTQMDASNVLTQVYISQSGRSKEYYSVVSLLKACSLDITLLFWCFLESGN